MAKTLTPKEIANEWGVSPKTLRKFLRKDMGDKAPGKGGRWSIEARSLKGLKTRFDAWVAANATKSEETDTEPETDENSSVEEEMTETVETE